MGELNTAYMYICKRIAEGRDKDICGEHSDCPHARPHVLRNITPLEMCNAYQGQCEVCIPIKEDWDK